MWGFLLASLEVKKGIISQPTAHHGLQLMGAEGDTWVEASRLDCFSGEFERSVLVWKVCFLGLWG